VGTDKSGFLKAHAPRFQEYRINLQSLVLSLKRAGWSLKPKQMARFIVLVELCTDYFDFANLKLLSHAKVKLNEHENRPFVADYSSELAMKSQDSRTSLESEFLSMTHACDSPEIQQHIICGPAPSVRPCARKPRIDLLTC